MIDIRRLTIMGLTVLSALVFGSPRAWAGTGRGLTGLFGSITSTPLNPYPLSSPSGVAVNEVTSGDVGDVYVVDKGNNRVEQFSSTGGFILMFGKGVNKTEVEATAPEADQDVCTAASGDTCQPGAAGFGEGQFSSPEDIAIDNDFASPSAGDVYVVNTDGDNAIEKFDSNGNYIGQLTE